MTTIGYELWDLEAGNRIGFYPDEATALAQVRTGINDDGADLWRAVGLRAIGERADESRSLAQGDELIARALAAPPPAAAEVGVMAGNGATADEVRVTTTRGSEVRVIDKGDEVVVRVRPARHGESAVVAGSMGGRVYPGHD